jgi:hypothetical protein
VRIILLTHDFLLGYNFDTSESSKLTPPFFKLAVEFLPDLGVPGASMGLPAQLSVPDCLQSAYPWVSLIYKAPP